MDFSFVAYDGPKLSSDPSIRKTIRQQAMRDIAANRKRKGGYGKHNLRQYPIFSNKDSEVDQGLSSPKSQNANEGVVDVRKSVVSSQKLDVQNTTSNAHDKPVLKPPLHSPIALIHRSPGERTDIDRFSILFHLTPITGLRLGISHSKSSSTSNFIDDVLHTTGQGSRKLLLHIPSRYGYVSSLSHATDCVVAKLQQLMSPSGDVPTNSEAKVLFHYTKALGALKIALGDEKERTTAETLCAIELLGIFELLSGRSKASFMTHTSAAARMIEVRGADSFQTEFEVSLFTAHIGPIVMDCFLNNKSCFLEEERWKRVMLSAIIADASWSQQQDLVLALWGHLVGGPRAFKEVTKVALSATPVSNDIIEDLIDLVMVDRNDLLTWENMARHRCGFLRIETNVDTQETSIRWPKTKKEIRHYPSYVPQLMLSGTYLLCRMLKARLLVALSPFRFRSLEKECQDLASRVMEHSKTLTKSGNERIIDQVLTSQVIWIAKGIIDTKSTWSGPRADDEAPIEAWKFKAWCDAIGRTITT